ncbi:hypothetical protein FHS16_002208 [Paenibacillus endophyticus]|uniref:Uncharacterized protein n=1 Tax=Paenibacillus endophyticus TaxID=1294268 RepID=A0A7W5C6L7_9BACL|nr:hypothetical protein [Paenibacillus endophyticus]
MGLYYAKKQNVKVVFVKPGQKVLIIGKKHWTKKPHC